ncbi:hypothetical protein AMJ80_09070 [bacterium SM23_31]|nr:MAG: hypothetical protein AMJ80_09070 [bacterium SM23_31]
MSVADDIKEQYPILSVDFSERALKRLASQFQESNRFKGEVAAYAQEFNKLRDAVLEILTLRTLETAEGVNLDVIGDWVGIPRVGIPRSQAFFGYQNRPPLLPNSHLGYSERGVSTGGAYRQRFDAGDLQQLTDDEYRVVIRIKVLTNYTSNTIPQFVELFKEVFGVNVLVENGGAEARVYFFSTVSDFLRELITYSWQDSIGQKRLFIPKTLGVQIFYRQNPTGAFFGYSANPNAKGYKVGAYAAPAELQG